MRSKHKNILGSLLGVLLFLVVFSVTSGRADAATISVGGSCTLPAAITNSNADDQSGSVNCTAGSGVDTITIPAGVITLNADLPALTESVIISGAGKTDTTINGAGNLVFNADFGNQPPHNTQDVTIQNMAIVGADPYAVDITKARTVLLDNLEISESKLVIRVNETTNSTLTNSFLHDNTDTVLGQGRFVGVYFKSASLTAGGTTNSTISNTKISNNSGDSVGIFYDPAEDVIGGSDKLDEINFTTNNLEISNNTAESGAGMVIIAGNGPLSQTPVNLDIDATTIANNTVTVTEAVAPTGNYLPLIAGFFFSGKMGATQQMANVTVAYNAITNTLDSRRAFAGFGTSMSDSGADLDIVNTTVVGNSITQTNPALLSPAFFSIKATLNQSYQLVSIANGSTAKNVLVAQNKFNGVSKNCWDAADLSVYGISETLDVTPVNLGNNLSDDLTCTGYQYIAGLYDTIDHTVKDNGGSVPTIALLANSPAINAGGQVLGITTDARGVVRSGYYSVGAYQGVLAANTTEAGLTGSLAETGAVEISAAILAGIFLLSTGFIYADYRRHKKPLRAIDPNIHYTFLHHMKVVTIPLFRYRLSIKVSRVNPLSKDGVHRF